MSGLLDLTALESAADWWDIMRRGDGDIETRARVAGTHLYVHARQRRSETRQQCIDRLVDMALSAKQEVPA